MPKLLCPHCLQPLDGGYRGECPHCGRSLENRNPEGALPLGTQLGGRYTVGTYLSADGDGLAYRGVLNDEKKFVLIKEYFPVTLCNGRSADGALMPKEEKEVLFKTSRMDFKDLYDDLKNLTPATGLSTILDVMEENNTVYAVEESEKGMTLSHYLHLRSRTLTPAEARTLLQPIMEGVALLHKSGLIHRGICPDNIVLPIDGTARLTGYGTLALRTGGSELKSQLYPGYAAPEQYSAAEFSGRYTDVYALAAVCYRMVTGQTPVAAPQRKVRDSIESAHSLEAGVPTWFSQVLACALRLDPAKRMQTVPEPMSALTRMAFSDHRKVEVTKDDLIIISATPIPGNEKSVSNVVNELFKIGAEVIYKSLAEVHVSGHACQEELKLILALTKPKFFIPVHGEHRHLVLHKELAQKVGIPEKNSFVLSNGQVLELDSKTAKIAGTVPAGKILVDGLGVGDVGNIVLRDRKHLSQDGLIIVVVTISHDSKEIVSKPDVISRGFVYVREAESLIEGVKHVAGESISDCLGKRNMDWSTLKSSMKASVAKYIYEQTKRSPMILPIIEEI